MTPNTVLYKFYLEFNLGYKDRSAYKFDFKNENVTVFFENKKLFSRYQFGGTETSWERNEYKSINFPSDGDEAAYQTYYLSKRDDFSLAGYLRRRTATVVTILFSTNIPDKDQPTFARACFAYFLDVYRLYTFFGNPENHAKLFSVAEEVQKVYLEDDRYITGGFKKILLSQPLPRPNIHSKFRIEKNEDRRIEDRLTTETDLAIFEKLICEGKRLLENDESFTLAIVVFETALETFVQKYIKDLCSVYSKTKLRYRCKNVKISEVIEKANIRVLVSECIPEITGEIVDNTIVQQWDSDLYKVRNGIVHRGVLRHSREQAEKAYKAMLNMICHIKGIEPELPK